MEAIQQAIEQLREHYCHVDWALGNTHYCSEQYSAEQFILFLERKKHSMLECLYRVQTELEYIRGNHAYRHTEFYKVLIQLQSELSQALDLTLTTLPVELLTHIFEYLDAKSLGRLQRVNREMHQLLSSPASLPRHWPQDISRMNSSTLFEFTGTNVNHIIYVNGILFMHQHGKLLAIRDNIDGSTVCLDRINSPLIHVISQSRCRIFFSGSTLTYFDIRTNQFHSHLKTKIKFPNAICATSDLNVILINHISDTEDLLQIYDVNSDSIMSSHIAPRHKQYIFKHALFAVTDSKLVRIDLDALLFNQPYREEPLFSLDSCLDIIRLPTLPYLTIDDGKQLIFYHVKTGAKVLSDRSSLFEAVVIEDLKHNIIILCSGSHISQYQLPNLRKSKSVATGTVLTDSSKNFIKILGVNASTQLCCSVRPKNSSSRRMTMKRLTFFRTKETPMTTDTFDKQPSL